jgi:hypothetical protein
MKPHDLARLFTPKLPHPIVPAPVPASSFPPHEDSSNAILYFGLGVLFVTLAACAFYDAKQNQKILQSIREMHESNLKENLPFLKEITSPVLRNSVSVCKNF